MPCLLLLLRGVHKPSLAWRAASAVRTPAMWAAGAEEVAAAVRVGKEGRV
jgi:hypothetical protein